MTRFLDSYAILGVLRGEQGYEDVPLRGSATHEMNLLEVAVKLLRLGYQDPWKLLDARELRPMASTRADLVSASRLKATPLARSRRLSYIDALAYVSARRLGLVFVTGDKGFQGLPGVDFRPRA